MSRTKYPIMPDDVRRKLRGLRVHGKKGLTTESEDLWCSEMFDKYGSDQYGSVITARELYEESAPYGAKPYAGD